MAEGNGNGNNKAAQWIPTGVLILAVSLFGLWWQSANPTARIDRLEINQAGNRKEFNEALSVLRKEEHNELVLRISDYMLKSQFESWKGERDFRTEKLNDDLKEINHKIEVLGQQIHDIKKQ